MKERQTQHRIWLIVAVLTTLFFVIILLVVMRENRELRRRNLALYHRSLEVLKSDEMAGKQRKTVSAPAVEENNATTASSKYHHSTLSDADKDRIAQLVQQVMEQTEVIIQPDFTVEKLAQNISTGQKYVSQVINETFECNFNTLLGRYRIREACRRFNDPQRYGSYTIESIARDLGFKSRSNFATTFKKHTGLNQYFAKAASYSSLRKGDWRFVIVLMSVGFLILIFAVINYRRGILSSAGAV